VDVEAPKHSPTTSHAYVGLMRGRIPARVILQTARSLSGRCSQQAANMVKLPHLIIVVDDSNSVRRSLESLLRSLGFDVLSFASAEDFLVSHKREASCVITDVEMPGLSGVDLYEVMRGALDHTPVIFITAASEQKVRSRLGSGPCVLGKPFEVKDLASCLEKVIAE
jgi:FixJ family two-component response regulator